MRYLQVDFGEADGPRTVLSGLVNFVPIEQMKDRWVVGICNLKPQAMRGIKSHAMLLCATAKEGKEGGVEPVYPPEGSAVGDRIEVEGYEGQEPLEQLNPKKKVSFSGADGLRGRHDLMLSLPSLLSTMFLYRSLKRFSRATRLRMQRRPLGLDLWWGQQGKEQTSRNRGCSGRQRESATRPTLLGLPCHSGSQVPVSMQDHHLSDRAL